MDESSLYRTALLKAMGICSRREFCVSDIETRLESWGVSNSDSQKIVGTLINENFINEERYSHAFVKDKFKYNGWGKIKIAAHLRTKRIPSDIISSALESVDNELYINTLKSLIESHRRSVKAKNSYEIKSRLLRFGLSRGFESSLLYNILNTLDDID
jgi:regulatory protein